MAVESRDTSSRKRTRRNRKGERNSSRTEAVSCDLPCLVLVVRDPTCCGYSAQRMCACAVLSQATSDRTTHALGADVAASAASMPSSAARGAEAVLPLGRGAPAVPIPPGVHPRVTGHSDHIGPRSEGTWWTQDCWQRQPDTGWKQSRLIFSEPQRWRSGSADALAPEGIRVMPVGGAAAAAVTPLTAGGAAALHRQTAARARSLPGMSMARGHSVQRVPATILTPLPSPRLSRPASRCCRCVCQRPSRSRDG